MNKQDFPYLSIIILFVYIIFVYITYPESNILEDSLTVDNQFYAKFLALVILVYPFEQILKKGLGAIIHTDVVLIQSFIYWSLLDVIQARYPLTEVSLTAVKYTFIYIAIFIVAIIIGTNFTLKLPKIIYEASLVDLSAKVLFNFFIISFFIAVYYYYKSAYYDFNYMIKALTKPRFSSPWARGAEGGFGAILEHLKYFGYFLPSVAVLYAIKVKKITIKVLLLFALAVFFSAFEFQGGGRRITGFLAGVAVITFMVYKRNDLKIYHFIGLGVIGGGMLILLDMQLAFRNGGYDGMFEKYEIETLSEVRVDDNFFRIAQVIDWMPSIYPHAGSQWLIYSLSRPIPRYFWPGKPLNPGYDVAKMAGEYNVSLTTTVVGEAYASGGVYMIMFIGFIYGLVAASFRNLLYTNLGVLGFAIYSIGTLATVGGVRALVDFIIFSYALVGILVLFRFFLRKRSITISEQTVIPENQI